MPFPISRQPTKKDIIGYYYHVQNWLMCSNEKYFKRWPHFNVCKEDVLKKIDSVWRKSSLPIINKKSKETKLKKLIKQYILAKAKKKWSAIFSFGNPV